MTHQLTDLTPEEIAQALDLKPFQGRQIFQWMHRRQVLDFERMTNLSKALRAQLVMTGLAAQATPVDVVVSPETGTKKTLYRLPDGEMVEAVLLRQGSRITLCLSCQAGCPIGCAFCATGLGGFRRDLAPGEIVEQALYLLDGEDLDDRTPNIVYMGMGEPFLNYDAVVKSVRLLMHPEGLGIGARKITISTAGVPGAIRRFAHEDWQVRLSISLHAANDTSRSKLVPLNRKYPLARLGDAIREYVQIAGRQVTFEWVLLRGVNDSPKDAEELAAYLEEFKSSVNLIPYNRVAELPYEPPSAEACESFRDHLARLGVAATLRKERGQDIDAACGQLRRRTLSSETTPPSA
ncbi:MAG TPA: 23S rRNA (adenine(2503)-C(2))-methyltransferase RlmN [Candidatus Hydrogenedentes bacterium]|nr:23S rRNA (adenine(2503)-C(2))-methyltransferase RlmN [Candidatus Hydrogenedentota bacterium]HPG65302.1 23S rRNA (adenine(2503)-C(2))-methyltransferase RlmN [Candidatus Hydrogenedentota bacterium]